MGISENKEIGMPRNTGFFHCAESSREQVNPKWWASGFLTTVLPEPGKHW
jgi:hypothetical protein